MKKITVEIINPEAIPVAKEKLAKTLVEMYKNSLKKGLSYETKETTEKA